VAATARRLGVRTVAVYSDADAGSRHVRPSPTGGAHRPGAGAGQLPAGCCDHRHGGEHGAQAIHPAYGFLSENEAFRQGRADAGWFHRPPRARSPRWASKSEAKALIEAASVPLVRATTAPTRTRGCCTRGRAHRLPGADQGALGGAGKGMRIVTRAGSSPDMLASCKREAAPAWQ